MFIGRTRELEALNAMYKSNQFSFPVISGRRRIGKTTLLSEFTKDKEVIFYQAIENSMIQNLSRLSSRIEQCEMGISSDTATGRTFSDFETALTYVSQLAKKKPLVFVIDEYPYLAQAYPEISSILQEIIDHDYKYNPNLMFILSGSSMSFMEKQVLGVKSPLYGRRTTHFKLSPFTPDEVRVALPKVSLEDAITYFGITGGFPLYLSTIDEERSVLENIEQLYLNPYSMLLEEPRNLLQQELEKPASYNAVLDAIAHGKSRLNEISTASGFSNSHVTKLLQNLMDLGIVEKDQPLTEKNKKKTIYRISDGMFRFWYNFIERNEDRIAQGNIRAVKTMIEARMSDFLGQTFEEVCKWWIWQKDFEDAFSEPVQTVGKWWGNNPQLKREDEIDVVAVNDRNQAIVIGECKWRNEKVGKEVVSVLIERQNLIQHASLTKVVFSKSGFKAEAKKNAKENDVLLVTLEEMFTS